VGRVIDHLRRPSKLRRRDLTQAQLERDGEWSRSRLLKMDAKFRAAVERSLARRRPVELPRKDAPTGLLWGSGAPPIGPLRPHFRGQETRSSGYGADIK
jgi:hypothetical protein